MAELTKRERVYAEQVRQLYRLSRPAHVGSLINSSILVFALWGVVSATLLGAWLCAMFMVTGARFLLYRAYNGLKPPDHEAGQWARYFVAGAAAAGLLWGVAGSALYPVTSLPLQFLVIFLIGGMTMAATVILAAVPVAFFAFMLPALVPMLVTVFLQGSTLHLYMVALMIVYILVVISIVPLVANMLREALLVKFENTELVEQVSAANRERSARIGAQQRVEEVLRQSEQRYRYMFEANPLPMWIRDEQSMDMLSVNEAALRSYGYTRAEFLGLKSTDLHLPEELGRYVEAIRARDPMRSFTSQWRHRRKDGSVMEVETVSYPFDLDGRTARLTLVNDITERRRAERRLQLGHTITRILAEARSAEEALPQALQAICESGGWVYGQRWALDKAANQLHCAET